VDFDFTDEQYALRDLVRELFERESPPSRLRSLLNEEGPRDDKVWRTMAEAGILGITVPDRYGGLGGNEIDLALVLEEAGRACLPEPLVETVAIAAPLLATAGTDEQRREWLPRIVAGDAVVAVQLDGEPFVADADIADLLVVEWADELYAVPGGQFTQRRVPSEDGTRRIFEVDADFTTATHMAGGPPEAAEAARRGAAATAGFLNGIAMRFLEMTVEHVTSRNQFDRPVGSFQAVKHKLADVHVMVESSRAAAWYAAYAMANGLSDREVAASVAKAAAGEAERRANTEALQCHGGIGFTWEHDLHFWLKRGNALEAAYGTARGHRATLARHVFQDTDA
jgi:alkylation response protein AidB-like acyl-CoA dehydrogenase